MGSVAAGFGVWGCGGTAWCVGEDGRAGEGWEWDVDFCVEGGVVVGFVVFGMVGCGSWICRCGPGVWIVHGWFCGSCDCARLES